MQHQNPTQILNSGNYQMFFSDYFKGCKKIILSHYFLTLKKIQLFATAASLKSSLKASRDKMGKKYRHKKKQKKTTTFASDKNSEGLVIDYSKHARVSLII